MKLGKHAPLRLLSTPSLGNFLDKATSWPAVKAWGWEYAAAPIKLDMLANDTLGDCVIAACMHFAQVETANTGAPLTPNAELAIQTYSAVTGYDPSQTDDQGNNPTDQGTSFESQMFPYWIKTGIPMLDAKGNLVYHKIKGFAALDITSIQQQRYATFLFGGSLLGIQVPQSAMPSGPGEVPNWNTFTGPILGGHGINRMGQGAAGGEVASWGMKIPYTNAFAQQAMDESYIVTTDQWLNSTTGKSPTGLDLNGLLAAQAAL